MQGLNGIDSNLLLKALEQRNATALVPVQSNQIQSVHQIDKSKLQVTLKTGDSMTLHLEHGPMAYATVSNEEGQKAIKQLKAQKYLNEKGIDTRNMNGEEIIDTAGLTRTWSNEQAQDTHFLSKEDEQLVNEIKRSFAEMSNTTRNKEDKELVNEFKQFFSK